MTIEQRHEIEALIAHVALGNQAAFSRLYDTTSGKLLAVCLRVLNERAAAEDAMQEVFIKVWKNADRYQVTGHSPMTWLITIAPSFRISEIDRLTPVLHPGRCAPRPPLEGRVPSRSEARDLHRAASQRPGAHTRNP